MRLTRTLVAGALLLLLAITTTSAYIRLNLAGLGCDDWPQCYRVAQAAGGLAADVDIARGLHRVVASLAGVWVIVLAAIAWSELRRGRPRIAAVGLVVLAALLAWLGRATPSVLPAVTLGNLLGGMLMVAFAAYLWGWCAAAARTGAGGPTSDPASGPPPALTADAQDGPAHVRPVAAGRGILLATLALLFVQMALGGLLGAHGAATECTQLPLCGSDWLATDTAWQVFWPFATDASTQPAGARAAALDALHALHRVLGLLVVGAAAWATFALLRRRDAGPPPSGQAARASRAGHTPAAAAAAPAIPAAISAAGSESSSAAGCAPSAVLALACAIALPLVGARMIASDYPLLLALAHNVLAALLVAALAAAYGRLSAGSSSAARLFA